MSNEQRRFIDTVQDTDNIKFSRSSSRPPFHPHCSLDELPLQLALPPGIQEAAPHSQSSAGLWRVELNDAQRQRAQGRRAEKEIYKIYSVSLAMALQCGHAKRCICGCRVSELHNFHCCVWSRQVELRALLTVLGCEKGWKMHFILCSHVCVTQRLWYLSNSLGLAKPLCLKVHLE